MEIFLTDVIGLTFINLSGAIKKNNCSFCDKSTIFTGRLFLNMTIRIRYGGISEINPDNRKFKFLRFHYKTLMLAKFVKDYSL